jgi:hypothetical protein
MSKKCTCRQGIFKPPLFVYYQIHSHTRLLMTPVSLYIISFIVRIIKGVDLLTVSYECIRDNNAGLLRGRLAVFHI